MDNNPTYEELEREVSTLRRTVIENNYLKRVEVIKERESWFKTMAEASMIGIYIFQEMNFLYINPMVMTIFEDSFDNFLTKSPLDYTHHDYHQASEEYIRRQMSDNPDIHPFTFKGLKANGKEIYCELQARKIEIQNKPAILGSIVDITKRKRTEEVLRKNEEKIVRLKKMESLGILAGGVAHDLNNVLAGIVSYPELILLDLPGDSKFRKAIETIKESGDRAVAIVQDLLTVARGVATTKEPLNLNDLIGGYLQSPEYQKLKQFHPTVTVKTNLDSELLNISASPVHIRKVVMNLVSNASEAIKGSGNVTISTANRYVDKPLRGYDDITIGEFAVLAVSDDGSGILSDDLERIFEPFYTKKVMGRSGTGLGLAVVWNVVQDHKGYIDVTSNQDSTTFELFFPITREEISGKDLSVPLKDLRGDRQRILVIDDVESQRHISCKMLDTFGYRTKAVSSGEEAVEHLKENTVDLILLDMIMDPGINGRETYERIKNIHPNQKAIIVSGFAETDDVRETKKLGAGQFIKKPLTLEKIGMAVKEELEKK